jgi:single-stranded-DNA-specific exonuclease
MLLAGRGFASDEEIERFLHPNYSAGLSDPYLLTDMDKAVSRIIKAVEDRENIVVYGDYDIDGITASAVMLETIENLGHEATSYIPNRFEEGYGINLEALKKLKEQGTDLVISVDCGVTSVNEIAWANEHGLDVVITDHHAVPEVIPEAIAVVNPKRSDDTYPFKDLAGVGVAFKVAQALQQRTGKPSAGQEKWLLDLVAFGTVCDVVTLLGENRVLAKYGLLVMRKTRRVGLRALASVSGVNIEDVRSYHLGFIFGPRMNAAGRLDSATRSLELMRTQDRERAYEIASELNDLNRQRQEDQARILREASKMAEEYAEYPVLVLASPDWSHGIVGIVASKIVEQFRKPALVMQILGETSKGSARSTGNFNLIEALGVVSDNFIKYGGHHFAAGYTLNTDNLDKLRADLNRYYNEAIGDREEPRSIIEPEAAIADLSEIDWELYGALELIEPYGNGNPQPIFTSQDLKIVRATRMGKEQTHLKLALAAASGSTIEAVGFGLAEKHPNLREGQLLNATVHLTKSE